MGKLRKYISVLMICCVLGGFCSFPCYASEIATDSNSYENTDTVNSDETNLDDADDTSNNADTVNIDEDYDLETYSDSGASEYYETVVQLLNYILGILIFFLIIVLCKYIYSFFNIFF